MKNTEENSLTVGGDLEESPLDDINIRKTKADAKPELESNFENESEADTAVTIEEQKEPSCLRKWAHFIENRKAPLLRILKRVAVYCAMNPGKTIFFVIMLSLVLLGIGYKTNFRIETDGDYLWAPSGSIAVRHREWIRNDSGFDKEARVVLAQISKGGDDILGFEGVRHTFQVLNLIRSQPEYVQVCRHTQADPNYEPCRIRSVTGFWDHNVTLFENFAADATHDDLIDALSALSFTDGVLVNRVKVLGTVDPPVYDNAYGKVYDFEEIRLKSAKSYRIAAFVPSDTDEDTALEFEKNVIDTLMELRDEWKKDPNIDWELDFLTGRSFDDELQRGIVQDIPLMVGTFVIMGLFCTVYFAKRDRVLSRSAMGSCAVFSVLLSLMTGYGLLFIIGIPFTSLTQIFPFILIGIGLDDGFIIIGAFDRTDPNESPVKRVEEAMDEIGVSIFVSTLTTFMAFMLGSVTQIPAIRWFCFYAGPCVVIDFIYQITFFIAVLVLDQWRIKYNLYDIFCCCRASRPRSIAEETPENIGRGHIDTVGNLDDDNHAELEEGGNIKLDFTSRLMAKYISFLLGPTTKVCVLVFFAILLVLGAISASKLEEAFDFKVLTPNGSYLDSYLDATEAYSVDDPSLFGAWLYTRDLDLTAEENRTAMDKYVNDIVDIEHITFFPTYYWHNDFNFFVNRSGDEVQNMSFNNQITMFLETEPFKTLYTNHIVLDDTGNVIQTRTRVTFDKVDQGDVKGQVDALLDQREVAMSQPLNEGQKDWFFFAYGDTFDIWEFYDVVVKELLLTTALAIASVAIITLFFIPHPFGSLIVTLTVGMVFVDLLGLLQIAGLYINSVTSIGLVMSIGLVVDFVMHVVHIYFEVDEDSRDKKVAHTLMTMGKSILVGGFSTFLGTLPLCLGSSEVFWTFFVTFLGIVSLGVSHGIMFIPVVLSFIAPAYKPEHPHELKRRSLISSIRSLNRV